MTLLGNRCLVAQQDSNAGLERQLKAASEAYDAGRFAETASQLESILPRAPWSFEVQELLGLAYAAQSRNTEAVKHLQAAAALRPDAVVAHTNLAAALLHQGKLNEAGEQFRRAQALAPQDYDTNHNLGEYYVQSQKIAEALPLLQRAQALNSSSYDNGYDLALALFLTGRLDDARQLLQTMVQQKDTGELHNLLGQVQEKDGKYLEAASQFAIAAHMDPSEDNLFVWGSELLLHRTYEPAIEVFQQASQRYPQSPRLLIGLGMALYARGKYQDSIRSLLAASDLDPNDPRCYLFLSKAYLSSPSQADDVIQRFRRYAEGQPANALAQYYYAVSLWKGKRQDESAVDFAQVESLLRKAISLDDRLAEAHLQLGILYAGQHAYDKSLPEYTRTLELDPNLPDAHYRLGQYYVHAGRKDRAQQEFLLYQKLQSRHQAEVDKERAEVQQFVVSAKAAPAVTP